MAILTDKNTHKSDSSHAKGDVSPDVGYSSENILGSKMKKDYVKNVLSRNTKTAEQFHSAKVKPSDLVLFTTQLSVMLDSGVVLSDALDAIAVQLERGTLKEIIADVAETVKNGETFSNALSAYPKVFNSMFISIVKASEASGKMVEMLRVISGYLTFEVDTSKRIKAALTYPFIMALMAVAATGTLMFFVLPRFMKIYEARGAALPGLTKMLVGFSSVIGDFRMLTIIVTSLIFIAGLLHYWFATPGGKRFLDYAKIKIPVLGTMFIDLVVTRSMRIMSTMINTGVSLLDSIEVVKDSCDNVYFKSLWSDIDEKIRDGYQFSESIQISDRQRLIAPGIIQMLKAGEKTGMLGEVSDKISVFYEKKLQVSIKSVMTLIEPLMITILGIIIGTIAIALLMPVFKISSVISR